MALSISISDYQQKRKEDNIFITRNESRILKMLAFGNEKDALARSLHLSKITIEIYLDKLLSKFQVKNECQLVFKACKLGYI